MKSVLVLFLQAGAVLQIGLAMLHLAIASSFASVALALRLPREISEPIAVQLILIALITAVIAVITLRFARRMALGGDSLCRWLAFGSAAFWSFRALAQLVWLTNGPFPNPGLHLVSFLLYGSLAALYVFAGAAGKITNESSSASWKGGAP